MPRRGRRHRRAGRFPVSDYAFRRAGLDYLDAVEIVRHASFARFETVRKAGPRRLVLLSTRGDQAYLDFRFDPADIVMLGRESAGVPDAVHAAADAVLRIPLQPRMRSLNVAVAGAMALGEALRQTAGFAQAPASGEGRG